MDHESCSVAHLEAFLPTCVLRHFDDDASLSSAAVVEDKLEAAVLFIDLSEFITLTERYTALEGTQGSAMLAQILTICFSRLSTAILQCGGDVIRFCTDSIIALWPLSIHETGATHRAVRCALAIQHADHILDLKIGIATGPTTLTHLRGSSTNLCVEYILTGLALQQAISAQDLAMPKEVVCSAEAWIQVKSQFEFTTVHGSYFRVLRARDPVNLEQPMRVAAPSLANRLEPNSLECLKAYLPAQVAQTYLNGHVQGQVVTEWISELRTVTVLAMDFGVADVTSGEKGENIQTCFTIAHAAAQRMGGSVMSIFCDDDRLTAFLVFGLFPMAHRDDPTRALVTAAHIASSLRELNLLPRAAITTGLSYCGVIGESCERKDFCVVGDRVNFALRVLRRFPPDNKAISIETWTLTIDAATKSGADIAATETFTQSSFEEEPVFTCAGYNDCSQELLAGRLAEMLQGGEPRGRAGLGRLRAAGSLSGSPEETAREIRYALDDAAFQFFLIQGGPGSGKTHLLRLIYQQILTSSTPRDQPSRAICIAVGRLNREQTCAVWISIVRKVMALERPAMIRPAQTRPPSPLELAIAREKRGDEEVSVRDAEALLMRWLRASGSNLVSHAWALNDLFGTGFPRPEEAAGGSSEDVANLLERARMSLLADVLEGINRSINYRIVCLIDDANFMEFMSWMVTLSVQDLSNIFVILASSPLNRRMVLKGSICEKIYETYTNLLQLPTTYLTEIEPLSLREMSAIVKSELNVLTVPEGIIDHVATLSAGNPFIVKQVVAHLLQSGSVIVDHSALTCSSPVFPSLPASALSPNPFPPLRKASASSKRARSLMAGGGGRNLKIYMSARLRRRATNESGKQEGSPLPAARALLAQKIDEVSYLQQVILKVAAHDDASGFHKGTVLEALPLKGFSFSYLDKCFDGIVQIGLIRPIDPEGPSGRFTFTYPLMREILRSRVLQSQKSKMERRLANAKLDMVEGKFDCHPLQIQSVRSAKPRAAKQHDPSAKNTFAARLVKQIKFYPSRKKSFRR